MMNSVKSNLIVQDEAEYRTSLLSGTGEPSMVPVYEQQRYIDLNTGQLWIAYNLDQSGDLTSSDWIPLLNGSADETFDIAGLEGQNNMNNGDFFGVLKLIQPGLYDTVSTLTNNLNLNPGQSFQLRASLYKLSDGSLIEEGVRQLDENSPSDIQPVTLNNIIRITKPEFVYRVIGVNDNVGGGSVSAYRSTANGLNNANIAFQISNPTGAMPSILPALTNSNNVFYQLTFKS